MSSGPCKNQSCASYGAPHPNCKCYGGMAEGGEAHFCATDRAHQAGCEYFAEGTPDEPVKAGGSDVLPQGVPLDPAPAESAPQEAPAQVSDSGIPDVGEGYELEASHDPNVGEGYELEGGNHQSMGEKILTGAEGAVQGLLGPIEPWLVKHAMVMPAAEKMLSYEEQDARREANPEIFAATKGATAIGSLMTGVGEAAAIAKASEIATGSKILQGVIQAGLLQGGDEVSKWILGHDSPEDAVGAVTAVGASMLFGGLMSGAGEYAKAGATTSLKKIAEARLGERAMGFLHGVYTAAKNQEPEAREAAEALMKNAYGLSSRAFKNGMSFFDKIIPASTGAYGAIQGYKEDGIEGAAKGFLAGSFAGYLGQKTTTTLGSKLIAPVMLKVLSSGNVVGAAEAFDHAVIMAQNSKLLHGTIESLFKTNPAMLQQSISAYGGDKLKKDLDTFIGKGGVTQSLQQQIYDQNSSEAQGFAEGGEVQKPRPSPGQIKPLLRPDDGVAIHYPAQNMLLTAARGRISNYLGGLRPQPQRSGLPFDDAPDTREQKRAYDRALSVAVSPLSVMHEIQRGSVEPEHIKHLTAMYPELTNLLQKKITESIVKAQIDGKKPSYKVRQGLSMLMGAPLSSEFTPQSIQAAQATFIKADNQQSGQPAPKTSGNKSILSKVDQSFLTNSQARQKRAQRP